MAGPKEVDIGATIDFPGRSFNLLVREYYRNLARNPRSGSGGFGNGQIIVLTGLNQTGVDIKWGSTVALEGLAADFSDGHQYKRPVIKAQLNSGSLHHSIMGVAINPTKNLHPGPFQISGPAWIKCNITDTAHKFAQLPVTQTDPIAESSTSGYPILDSEDPEGTGELWTLVMLGLGAGSGGDGVDIKVVLITEDIDPGVVEDDPPAILDHDTVTLTDVEIDAGTSTAFQDPPCDILTDNLHTDGLNLYAYERVAVEVNLKVFHTPGVTVLNTGTLVAGGSTTTSKIDPATSSLDDAAYFLARIEMTSGPSSGEIRDITDYDAAGFEVTVDPAWPGFGTPDTGDTYRIFKPEPGYDPDKTKLVLQTTSVLDDSYPEAPVKVYRYVYTTALWDASEPLKVGQYERHDYPEYDENAEWPPPAVRDPDVFFRKRLRGYVINGILIAAFCEELPPPPLPE